jgi:hypothetical protein
MQKMLLIFIRKIVSLLMEISNINLIPEKHLETFYNSINILIKDFNTKNPIEIKIYS